MNIANSVVDVIGRTPLIKLGPVVDGLTEATVVAKVEYFNPGGSAKDRLAVGMINAAEKAGLLKPGGTIVEPTSGNTGVGLALVAQQRGYKCIFVCPDKVSEDKRKVLEAYGAEVVVTPTNVEPDHPESYYSVSDRLAAEIPGGFKPNQYANPAGPQAHYETTGPEIWADTEGTVTHFVAGVGTGGTISGTGRYLKEVSDGRVRVIGADPYGSLYAGAEHARPYLVEGVGEDFWPEAYDRSIPDEIITVTDQDAFDMTRRLAREEGLLVGGSCGMAMVAGIEVAKKASKGDLVVVLLPDSGRGYLKKIFDDGWMNQHGFLTPEGVHTTWEASIAAVNPALATSGAHDSAQQRAEVLQSAGREIGIVTSATPPLQPGEAKGWFHVSDPGTIREVGELAVVGYGEAFDADVLAAHPGVMVMKHGQAIAVASAQELSKENS